MSLLWLFIFPDLILDAVLLLLTLLFVIIMIGIIALSSLSAKIKEIVKMHRDLQAKIAAITASGFIELNLDAKNRVQEKARTSAFFEREIVS
ncbi:hypothetical protein IV38_GL000882 [Lactobacillus selangorensis]|uniref:Uncharacterized protein n=1 Tax=Lactobacillus selangorensis TaxID=81857 RepID=A0A0R2FX61_9LACO|nr:hypothetical protein [Lactobacillus selangorensis]KRN28679.1 hypothetical protein IV38_GL000882 [Lactobacillus selangorensis]KRN32911.1 hypothetical protein IV40_GL000971 [Lactobacillus selangorensis]